ncbi:MAG: DUF389 domain-containing protein [Deltaproteobacteria bacterium]|nr:DUF389 domain-containing protein [Deltaproteobacteria bacterium]
MTSQFSLSIVRLQDKLASLLGCLPSQRVDHVAVMLRRDTTESTSYWFQLVVSGGIATLGLVTGSTAVVIAAMLVAPLMGPILGLGMGFATGSPFLTLRSGARVLWSVAMLVGFSAIVTVLLPFHEANPEITARTAPTLLDLVTAVFCALAGAYAAMKTDADVATTAAGTSIGISLVPPICVCGYGIGVRSYTMAGGAALLFLTNCVAIIVIATLAFLVAGFNQVPTEQLEHDELERDGRARFSRWVATKVSALLGKRMSPLLRIFMPVALLIAVYLPLRRGLDEVVWQVRARTAVAQAIAAISRPVLEQRVRLDRRTVDVSLVILGQPAQADRTREELERIVRAATGGLVRAEVVAVPDASQVAGLESSLREMPRVVAAAPAAVSPELQVNPARAVLDRRVRAQWPEDSAGIPLEIDVTTTGPAVMFTIIHLGAPLGDAAREALSRALSSESLGTVKVRTDSITSDPIVLDPRDLTGIVALSRAVERARDHAVLSLCIEDVAPPRGPLPATTAAYNAAIDTLAASMPRTVRRTITSGPSTARIVRGSCTPEAPPAAAAATVQPSGDAGSAGDGDR